MRKFLLFLLVLGFCSVAYAQERIEQRVDSLIANAQYGAAEKTINAALPASGEALAYSLTNKLAEIQIKLGNLDAAEKTLMTLKSSGGSIGPFLQAITKTNLGFLYLNKARNDLALQNLEEALALFESSGNKNSLEAAKCLSNICLVYSSTGKLNQAEENGLIALQIRLKLKGENSEEVAASYNDLGLVYGQKDPDKGLEYYEKALAVYQKLHGSEHPKIAIANTNLGFMYRKMKLYGDAVNNLESAEAVWKKIYPGGHPNQALALVNLGLTYQDMGDEKAALAFLEKALVIYRNSYGNTHPDISNVLNRIGILKKSANDFNGAIQAYQQAIIANVPGFNQPDFSKNPKVNSYYNGKVLISSLRGKAVSLEGRYLGKTLRFDDLKMALNCLLSADSLIDDIRNHSADENDKIELGSYANEVYEDGVRIAHAMSEMTLEFRKYREVSFYFAEKSKSSVLQQSIADAEAKSFAGIPEALLEEESNLKSSISLLSQKLSEKPGPEIEKSLRESLFTANRQYDSFVKRLEKDFPDYFNLKFNRTNPSIPDIQKLLDNKTAILCYFIGERLYSYIITKTRFSIYNATLPPDFDKMVKGFNNSLYFSVEDSYLTSNNVLSGLLLRGIPASCKDLIIIPAGRLSTMPFEALSPDKIRPGFNFATTRFLVDKVSISYEFSAGLLLQKSKSSVLNKDPSIFLCAPISFPAKDNLDELPATEAEVNGIAQLFKSNFIARNHDANERLVKSGKLAEYQYLHFATHGIVDEVSPELSRIFLQPEGAEDGNVFSGEIFNLKLNADLAVLSACQTGLGKFSKGEGVIGLSRALVYAGAKNIMVSYWSVADQSTSKLMTDFYTELLKQPVPNFREALQQAKVNMIRNKEYAAPYYWAPFVLIGF